MIDRDRITGVVLAGGLGRRMDPDGAGVDKGLVRFRGEPLAAHAIRRLRPQVGSLLVNANRHLDTYRGFGAPVVPDELPGFAGPLAGLASAMRHAQTDWVVTVPCDSPLFPADLVERLGQAVARDGAAGAVARAAGREQPVFLMARRDLLEDLTRFLASGQGKIDRWYHTWRPAVAAFEDEAAFRNINTLDELRALE